MRAAFTWVNNDMVGLELWCKYYSRYFDNLHILLIGTDDKYQQTLERFKDEYNAVTVNTEVGELNNDIHLKLVKDKQEELLKDNEWVIYADNDELVCTNPKKYRDLTDFMDKTKRDWAWCLGYEILQEPEEPHIDFSKPILRQRTSWLKNPYNNKVLLGRIPLSWNFGCQQIEETKGLPIEDMEDQGLYLLHLKHMDFDAPNRDWMPNRRQKYGYVMETFGSRKPMPEWVKEVI